MGIDLVADRPDGVRSGEENATLGTNTQLLTIEGTKFGGLQMPENRPKETTHILIQYRLGNIDTSSRSQKRS